MTSRPSASLFGFAAALLLAAGINAGASAQDAGPSSPAPKAKAADDAKKAESPDAAAAKEKAKADTNAAAKVEPKLEHAYFAGGCFWCLEAFFERVHGVKQVVSGYSGGTIARPTYDVVGTGFTGHAETVGIEYDANVVSYDDLLDIFWICHDPTTLNRQGLDVGTQYRSAIFYANEDQKKVAEKSYQKAVAAQLYPNPIVTELVPLEKFWPAEKYHQDYFKRNANKNPYCQSVIAPKIEELRIKLNAKARAKAQAEAAKKAQEQTKPEEKPSPEKTVPK